MTKQEEIREGIALSASPLDCTYCDYFGYCNWDKKGLCQARYDLADVVIKFLHSQGVVIKKKKDDYFGMVEVEPLIEVKDAKS